MERLEGVPVHRHFIGAYIPVLHEVCYLVSFVRELILRQREFDVVHVFQTQLSAFAAVLAAKRLGKRVVTTCHSLDSTKGDLTAWRFGLIARNMLKHVAVHLDGATGVSREIVTGLHRIGFPPELTWYIPNGVPIQPASLNTQKKAQPLPGIDGGSLLVLFVGRLAAPKLPESLLDAWLAVQCKFPNARLAFVGDGENRAELEASAERAGLKNTVLFVGRISHVNNYLRRADIFVLPSAREGMPLALLEAMAAGLPVIGSKTGGIADVIRHGENGLLVEPGDQEGLVSCLSLLMGSEERRSELGKKARHTVNQHFSLDAVADRYISLYKSLWT
jgi:glycosyltransferase involved in cell wall biosynthesis